MKTYWTGLLLAASLADAPAFASPLLDPAFQDHAVLQRGAPVRLSGAAAPGERITLTLADRSAQAVADAAGRWRAELPAPAQGGPFTLAVRAASGTEQTVSDLLVGDVWLCSGQSNMELPVRRARNADLELDGAANPQIRLLKVPRESAEAPRASTQAPLVWRAADRNSAQDFSAACFFMGEDLQRAEQVPIGLIDASWGGTPIQAWLSPAAARTIGAGDGLELLARSAQSLPHAEALLSERLDAWLDAHDPDARVSRAWRRPDFDDRSWPEPPASGGLWETWGRPELANFDGLVWFRSKVTLTRAQARQGATLALGPVDDIERTWVNGRAVGGRQGWNTPRTYVLPAGLLKAGENTIVVRALDTGGGGGFSAAPESQVLQFADGSTVRLGTWRYRVSTPYLKLGGPPPQAPWQPGSGLTILYNGMIAPIAAYSLRGVAWYQGENNVGEADRYAGMLTTLFADWRRTFGSDLSFLVVQLANFGPLASQPEDSAWAALREAQRRAVAADRNAALAVAIDIGEPRDIHPANKQEVGRRLALAARRLAYGESLLASGPRPIAARRTGPAVEVRFADVGDGLKTYSAARPIGFELCDGQDKCAYVDAEAAGDTVRLSPGPVADPRRVRFCWADSPVCNLAGSSALPAEPFELDLPAGG